MSRFLRSRVLLLEGSELELRPQLGFPDLYYVVDRRSPDVKVAGPLPLRDAKKSAVCHAAKEASK